MYALSSPMACPPIAAPRTAHDHAVAAFEADGLARVEDAVAPSLVARCHDAALDSLATCQAQARVRGDTGLGLGMEQGWNEIVQRAPRRFDMRFGCDRLPFAVPALGERAPWMPLVRRLLGPDCRLHFRGVLIALPGADEHPWHTDGEHLFADPGRVLPAHAINVFVPLVELARNNGATEFHPGSHRLGMDCADTWRQDASLPQRLGCRGDPVVPELHAGSALLFDYRLVHRAGPNLTGSARPVLYLTYVRPWFCDVHNFPERLLFPSGAQEQGGAGRD